MSVKVNKSNNLEAVFPSLAKQWHPTKNGKLKASQVTKSSTKVVWWKCSKGDDHEWESSVDCRTRSGRVNGCPFCAGKRVSKDNNLEVVFPELAKQWHPTKNGELFPAEVHKGSHKRVWWKCPEADDHEWEQRVSVRAGQQIGCPFCNGKRADKTNNLEVVSPELARQWHPTKNGELKPSEVTKRSHKRVWWKCQEGEDHEWRASISNRNRKIGGKCPFCEGKRVSQDNNLEVVSPELAKQWHPSKNGDLKPSGFTASAGRKVWWKCQEGDDHEWETTIDKRTQGNDCPFCSGQRVGKDNNLQVKYPDIAKEWHPTKNGKLRPSEVHHGKNGKVWWKCPAGDDHEWKTTVASRTRLGRGCPFCTNQTSESEIRILTEMMYIFDGVISRYKETGGEEMDVFIKSLGIGIEYDGWYWHRDKEKKDKDRNNYFKQNDIKIIRVRVAPLNLISENDISVKKDAITKNDLNLIVKNIIKVDPRAASDQAKSYLRLKSFGNEQTFKRYLSYFPDPFPEKSLETLFPDLCEQWDYEKNHPLEPKNFSYGSDKEVWWKCSKGDDHRWKIGIGQRTKGGKAQGCPFCGGKRVSKENSLQALFPEIAKQWHPTKNGGLKPSEVTKRSDKRVWWKCPEADGHEWVTQIKNRTRSVNPTGCPFCSRKRRT